VLVANTNGTSAWGGTWSDDWWIHDHGTPSDPSNAFSNQDIRKFQKLVGPSTVLRASTPASPVTRYHFGFQPSDWALWNTSRTSPNGINVIGPFNIPNVKASTHLDLSAAVPAVSNGHWYNGAFYLGTAPNDAENDSDGLGARYHVGTNAPPAYGYAGGVRADGYWRLWLR
jgi:hypothetical protein